MNCRKYLQLIEDLAEGELDEPIARQVDAHISACPQCGEQYEKLEREKTIYAHYLFDAEPPPQLWTNFEARLEAEKAKTAFVNKIPARAAPQKRNVFNFLRLFPALAGATLLLAFGIGFGWLKYAALETGDDKHAAKTELHVSQLSPNLASADKSATTDSPKKINDGATGIGRKNNSLAAKRESLKAKNVRAAANVELVAAQSAKIERRIISNVVESEKQTALATLAARNPARKNRLSEAERLQNARLKNLEKEIVGQIEKVEMLLRSFRNARALERVETFDVEYEREQARRLLEKNARLRRDAEGYGILDAEELLGKIEPYLLDIANLESNPAPDKVLDIKERVKNQNVIASLQIY